MQCMEDQGSNVALSCFAILCLDFSGLLTFYATCLCHHHHHKAQDIWILLLIHVIHELRKWSCKIKTFFFQSNHRKPVLRAPLRVWLGQEMYNFLLETMNIEWRVKGYFPSGRIIEPIEDHKVHEGTFHMFLLSQLISNFPYLRWCNPSADSIVSLAHSRCSSRSRHHHQQLERIVYICLEHSLFNVVWEGNIFYFSPSPSPLSLNVHDFMIQWRNLWRRVPVIYFVFQKYRK